MDVRAIVVLPDSCFTGVTQSMTLPVRPLLFADVLGQSVILRILGNLKMHGVRDVSLVTDIPQNDWPRLAAHERLSWKHTPTDQLWRAAEQKFAEFAHAGANVIVIMRAEAYAEIDYPVLLQFHVTRGQPLTCVVEGGTTPLDLYVINAQRRNEAAFLLRHELRQSRTSSQLFHFDGYVRRLATPRDLRTLAVDGLMQRTQMIPVGEEIRPGIWIGRGAHVHRRARVLSPAYIGAGARIRAAAVITRCSVLEHHTVVDCGTVAEDISTLPFSYIGAGLDVCHSIVGYGRLWNLQRNVEVEFADTRLIGNGPANSAVRTLGSLAALAGFLPSQLLRGIFAPSHREPSPSLPQAIQQPPAVLEAAKQGVHAPSPSVDAGEFPANLVIARRYGNQ